MEGSGTASQYLWRQIVFAERLLCHFTPRQLAECFVVIQYAGLVRMLKAMAVVKWDRSVM